MEILRPGVNNLYGHCTWWHEKMHKNGDTSWLRSW